MANVRRGKRVFAEINITPLTDVCLVLLIIFMVTATFLTQSSGLNVDLPKAAAAQNLPAHNVELTVTRDGAVYLDGGKVDKSQLAVLLAAKLRQTSLKAVVIKADADVPYRHVAEAMDAACVLGADITLAADLKAKLQQAK
jgi:biopolymer transport protein ExbD